MVVVVVVCFFFFKQKTAYEIGTGTGVQTCALPILKVPKFSGLGTEGSKDSLFINVLFQCFPV